MERTVIPKGCCLCDVCNKNLTDDSFIATEDSFWYEGWLYCVECAKKYKPHTFLKIILVIHEGDDISHTDLAKPMVFESW